MYNIAESQKSFWQKLQKCDVTQHLSFLLVAFILSYAYQNIKISEGNITYRVVQNKVTDKDFQICI